MLRVIGNSGDGRQEDPNTRRLHGPDRSGTSDWLIRFTLLEQLDMIDKRPYQGLLSHLPRGRWLDVGAAKGALRRIAMFRPVLTLRGHVWLQRIPQKHVWCSDVAMNMCSRTEKQPVFSS